MDWIGKLVASVTIFVATLFGGSHVPVPTVQHPATPLAPKTFSNTSGNNPEASTGSQASTVPSGLTATIDENSLHDTVGSYQVTGTAYGTEALDIGLVHSDYQGTNDYTAVANYVAANPGVAVMAPTKVVSNHWSVPLFTLNDQLSSTVLVYDSTTHSLLAKGALTVTATSTQEIFPSGLLVPTATSIPAGYQEEMHLAGLGTSYLDQYNAPNVSGILFISSGVSTTSLSYVSQVSALASQQTKLTDFTYQGMSGVVYQNPAQGRDDLTLLYQDGTRWVSIATQSFTASTHFTSDQLIAMLKTFTRQT
jgi:hypothetical protein